MSLRLSLAFEQGLAQPSGPVAVFRPAPDIDLGMFDAPEIFHTDRVALNALGIDPSQSDQKFSAAFVSVPRSKALAQALVAQAAASTDGPIIVDGQRTDGIDSLYKACRKRADVAGTVTKAHGRLFWFQGGAFEDWQSAYKDIGGWITQPGVFSADGIDKASAGLVAVLPALAGRVVDLGAGWGFLSAHVLTSDQVTHVDVVEAEGLALDCAQHNIDDPRAAFHWADALRFVPDTPADCVVMNPPFHTTRKGEPALGQAFIAHAASILKPRGSLWMVANRHLPYEDTLKAHFQSGDELVGPPGFKIFHAQRPRRA